MMSITDRDILHALCERQMKLILARLEYCRQNELGPFFSMAGQEYIVPPLHGPKDFQDFNVRYDKPIVDRVHELGGRVHVHCHGPLKSVFGGFLEAGIDVLHPVEPPPQGDITPAEAKELARGKMCIEGNIQINRMYEAEPEAIREETTALIEAAFDDRRGLIVSPTASPYIRGAGQECLARYEAMVETVRAWRG
jgi:uroporphyrinogen-III decarboxylase